MRIQHLPRLAVPVIAILLLAGCSSMEVHLSPSGRQVRAAYVDSVASCQQVGTATVSVTDHVGPFARGNLSVRDNLEVLARNAGAGLGANTVKPLGPPVDGQQQWGAYRCPPGPLPRAVGTTAAATPASAASAAPQLQPVEPAQTVPLRTEPLQVQPVSPNPAPAATAPWPAGSGSVPSPGGG